MPGAAPSIRNCTSVACVHLTAALSRCDQQTRVAVHSWRTAPIRCSASVSISSCITIRTDARLRSTPSPGGLAHLRGDWVGKEILGSTQPIWRHDASTFQGRRRIDHATCRRSRRPRRSSTKAVGCDRCRKANRVSRRSDIRAASLWRPCSPWVEGVADPVVGLQGRSEQAALARPRRCLRRASALDRRVSDGDRLRTVGEPDPCARTSRRTRGTTT
jgi:hypothetical protein